MFVCKKHQVISKFIFINALLLSFNLVAAAQEEINVTSGGIEVVHFTRTVKSLGLNNNDTCFHRLLGFDS
jgi:hypothetical protein